VPTIAAKAGSAALTIIAKETAPALWAKTEKECAAAAQKLTGIMETMSSIVTLGTVRISGAAHAKIE